MHLVLVLSQQQVRKVFHSSYASKFLMVYKTSAKVPQPQHPWHFTLDHISCGELSCALWGI